MTEPEYEHKWSTPPHKLSEAERAELRVNQPQKLRDLKRCEAYLAGKAAERTEDRADEQTQINKRTMYAAWFGAATGGVSLAWQIVTTVTNFD